VSRLRQGPADDGQLMMLSDEHASLYGRLRTNPGSFIEKDYVRVSKEKRNESTVVTAALRTIPLFLGSGVVAQQTAVRAPSLVAQAVPGNARVEPVLQRLAPRLRRHVTEVERDCGGVAVAGWLALVVRLAVLWSEHDSHPARQCRDGR